MERGAVRSISCTAGVRLFTRGFAERTTLEAGSLKPEGG